MDRETITYKPSTINNYTYLNRRREINEFLYKLYLHWEQLLIVLGNLWPCCHVLGLVTKSFVSWWAVWLTFIVLLLTHYCFCSTHVTYLLSVWVGAVFVNLLEVNCALNGLWDVSVLTFFSVGLVNVNIVGKQCLNYHRLHHLMYRCNQLPIRNVSRCPLLYQYLTPKYIDWCWIS